MDGHLPKPIQPAALWAELARLLGTPESALDLPETVKQMGAAEFVAKPASFDQINASLGRVLGTPPA